MVHISDFSDPCCKAAILILSAGLVGQFLGGLIAIMAPLQPASVVGH
jgi:hypothetical protein